ncbi:MAG: 2-C-methyl-D-erythritol 2,4-cyclodiphosphate synthase [Chloroflexota bacterium]
MRVGVGYDVHRFAPEGSGRTLVLGGLEFEGVPGLEGHSDADVVLHAIADAILGAAALGDIGDHFPPSDPRWRDVDSRALLHSVVQLARTEFEVHNIDLTVIAEAPKIGPMRAPMRESIASAVGIGVDRVSVKATTNERLGSIGRGEGIAAIAVVLLEEERG